MGFEGNVPSLRYQVTWARKKESQGPSAGPVMYDPVHSAESPSQNVSERVCIH